MTDDERTEILAAIARLAARSGSKPSAGRLVFYAIVWLLTLLIGGAIAVNVARAETIRFEETPGGPQIGIITFGNELESQAPDEQTAYAHVAPTGWAYDTYCCSDEDCAPIPKEWVSVTPQGFIVSAPGGPATLFKFDTVRQSGDSEYHGCIMPGASAWRCLYVPEFGA